MHTIEADFCEHPTVGQVMQRATVVLVNNEVFTSSLNDKLSLLFLDLPDSTRIVSLKAFAAHFKLTAHNRDSPLAILHQGPPLRYPHNSVSWKNEPGTYFIGEIRRSLLREFDDKERVRAEKRAVKLAAAKMRRTASAESRSLTPQTPGTPALG
jgi:H3 lysine-79-specific histone-lysine N-methyltransferase